MRQCFRPILFVLAIFSFSTQSLQAEEKAFTLIVMDPLAAPLSCPCVEGYAQRKYEA